MKIYERLFDNPKKADGTLKESKLLGNFEIIEVISEDSYSSEQIGVADDKVYLISEREVTGVNGGSRYEIKELKSLCKR
jgi:hypothetical protein